jgi:hypothetical protein
MRLEQIYGIIAKEGFTDIALQEINDYIKDIQNGTEDFPRFNLSEHAGLSKGGAPLIGASIIACYAAASLAASCKAEGREGGPANWEIDERQEQLIVTMFAGENTKQPIGDSP